MAFVKLRDDVDMPTWALCYLFNDDCSGMENEDVGEVNEWLENEFPDHYGLTFDCAETWGFNPFPEFGFACDTVKTEIWGHTREGV